MYIYLHNQISKYVYVYTYTYLCICMYKGGRGIDRERERERKRGRENREKSPDAGAPRKHGAEILLPFVGVVMGLVPSSCPRPAKRRCDSGAEGARAMSNASLHCI